MYLLPKPKKTEPKQGVYEITWNSVIVIDEKMQENGAVYASILQEGIQNSTGMECAVLKGKKCGNSIFLTVMPELSPQEYRIQMNGDGIVISGGDGAAVLYGVQTLCQMIAQCGGLLECVEIEDAPDIRYRGYFLDETRGRVLKLPYLKKIVDRLCRYKINQFQLYVEHTYLFRNLTEMWRDETPLTAEDILELDEYCRKRHIELVPALASFGHLYTLLSTRSYGELCERSRSWEEPFSFEDRMCHHTINPTDDRALPFVKEMIAEYGALFSSDKFNICADETFDLGCGKSKETAQKIGSGKLYIHYVKELCEFLVERGKQPMFFGDIIVREPELISLLPRETLCLTWGYEPNQPEDECRAMAQAGAVQYLCPGVGGWNQWMNRLEDAYSNITKMCGYARKYRAEGILNTDWGDFGHVNHPEFSVPAMIYGAAFSWDCSEIGFEEINRQISLLEYGDATGQAAGILAEMAKQSLFGWWGTDIYYEKHALGREKESNRLLLQEMLENAASNAEKAEKELQALVRRMKRIAVSMDTRAKGLTALADLAGEAMQVWNEVGAMMQRREKQKEKTEGKQEVWKREEAFRLAQRLERWFMAYKKQWRSVGREGDLTHIGEIVFWYADCLRGKKEEDG
jgi:N-acetyl-beta-hexosaminidase